MLSSTDLHALCSRAQLVDWLNDFKTFHNASSRGHNCIKLTPIISIDFTRFHPLRSSNFRTPLVRMARSGGIMDAPTSPLEIVAAPCPVAPALCSRRIAARCRAAASSPLRHRGGPWMAAGIAERHRAVSGSPRGGCQCRCCVRAPLPSH